MVQESQGLLSDSSGAQGQSADISGTAGPRLQCAWCQLVSPNRRVLDGKEKELRAALTELESQRGLESSLQSQLEEERQRHLHMEGQNTRSLEVPSTPTAPSRLRCMFALINLLCQTVSSGSWACVLSRIPS